MAIVGAGREHLAALVCIDIEAAGHWAQVEGVGYTSYADLSQKPEVLPLIQGVLAHTNEVLPEALKIRRFVNLPKEFDPDDGEVTRTRKLRRNVIDANYAKVIAALFEAGRQRGCGCACRLRDRRKGCHGAHAFYHDGGGRVMDWLFLGELAINGALTGLMYALCALGIVLIYKTSGVANLAQGALIMTGGYLAAWLTTGLGLSLAACNFDRPRLPLPHGLFDRAPGSAHA